MCGFLFVAVLHSLFCCRRTAEVSQGLESGVFPEFPLFKTREASARILCLPFQAKLKPYLAPIVNKKSPAALLLEYLLVELQVDYYY